MQVRSLGQEEPLEVEMAIHSSILAWKIQWTEESGGLQSKGSQRVGHDLATEYTHICLNGPWNINAVTIVMVFFLIYNVYINTIICSLHELVTSWSYVFTHILLLVTNIALGLWWRFMKKLASPFLFSIFVAYHVNQILLIKAWLLGYLETYTLRISGNGHWSQYFKQVTEVTHTHQNVRTTVLDDD